MAAAPQTRGAPPKLGVPSPLLILLLFLPGSRPDTTSWLPPITPPSRETTTPLSVRTSPDPGPRCGSWGGVRVYPVPPSSSGTLGSPHAIECHFEPEDANVTWLQVCPRRYPGRTWSCTWPQEVPAEGGGRQVSAGPGVSKLSFAHLRHNHSGLYFCRVRRGAAAAQSCGTFVRVEEAVPEPLLKLADATKNRILTAQGVLLLLCAAGPGLLLLFRKRWANERLLQPKKISLEEENLYEGLNLDECSMYEDISRGVQPTYQDVGTPPATDGLLEKP